MNDEDSGGKWMISIKKFMGAICSKGWTKYFACFSPLCGMEFDPSDHMVT